MADVSSQCTYDEIDGRASVQWSGIQMTLEEARSDVLLLLDTAGSTFISTSTPNGVKEMLCASGFEALVPPRMFTKFLIAELKERANSHPFSITELHCAMLFRTRQHWPQDGSQCNGLTPIYLARRPQQQSARYIQLSRMQSSVCGIASGTTSTEQSLELESTRDEARGTKRSMVADTPRILIAIRLDSLDEPLSIDALKEWLRRMPALVNPVKIEASFSSF